MNTQNCKLLVVDDEAFNREILEEMLTSVGYIVEMAADGEKAWQMLDSGKHFFGAVLLDRMMPRLDGMGLLARMKADKRFSALPVIFQTAIDHPLDIAEGIKAGAFYYLVKPVNESVLFAIVQSAVHTYLLSSKAGRQESAEQTNLANVLQRGEFQLHTLPEARSLAMYLSNFYPEPQRVFLGILELLINAVEHGNLGITYQEKSELLKSGQWESEVTRRLELPGYANKNVEVLVEHIADKIKLTIRDEGQGFESRKYMDISPERAFDPNGRGIALSRMTSFDFLEYNEKGNQVVAIVTA